MEDIVDFSVFRLHFRRALHGPDRNTEIPVAAAFPIPIHKYYTRPMSVPSKINPRLSLKCSLSRKKVRLRCNKSKTCLLASLTRYSFPTWSLDTADLSSASSSSLSWEISPSEAGAEGAGVMAREPIGDGGSEIGRGKFSLKKSS